MDARQAAAKKKYRETHREEIREYMRLWRARNPERVAEYERRHKTTPEAAHRRYLTWYSKNRALAIRRAAEWARAHPDIALAKTARRRARLRGAVGSHTVQEWKEKCELFAHLCAYCGEAKPLTRDHKTPVSRGGTDYIDNIIPACKSCNSRKTFMTVAEFFARRSAA